MKLEDIHLKNIRVLDVVEPAGKYMFAYWFVKNNQSMTRYDFKETFESIRDILAEQSVNSAILMMAEGTMVFTETEPKLNALMIKLSTGINFEGDVSGPLKNLYMVNESLGRSDDKNKNSNT